MNLESFILLKKIGSGRFGQVFMVREKVTGFLMAMKIQDKRKIL